MDFVEPAPGDARLAEIYPVLHELRDELTHEQFAARYEEGYPDGYRIVALYDAGECSAVAGYRIQTNFVHGRILYIDDLVTSSRRRSKGYGRALNDYVLGIAREAGCERVTLDSGLQRARAHRFYFREGYVVTSFHFGRPLG